MPAEQFPTVADYMARTVYTVTPQMPILDAVDFFLQHRISGAPVVDSGELVGVLSEKDCLRLLAIGADGDVPRGTVGEYMTRDVKTIRSTMDIYYVAGLFIANVYRRFPVVDDGTLVGQISRRDILRAIQTRVREMP